MKSKISICFLTIVVILLALVMIEKINTQRAADKAAIIAQSNENDKEEKNEKESLLTSNEAKNAKYCITNGLYFFNETDLYDFLESYSS